MTATYTGDLQRVADAYRRSLKARDAKVLGDLARNFSTVYTRAQSEYNLLSRQIAKAQAQGIDFSPNWLFRQSRMEELMKQVGDSLDTFTKDAHIKLQSAHDAAVTDAINYAHNSTAAALGTTPSTLAQYWTQISQPALQAILANTAMGGPVHNLLTSIAPQGAQEARQALVNGVVQGKNPKVVARELRQALGTTLTRSQTIARTEMMRANRSATLETYRANSDVVHGWSWSAADDDQTCEECWALDGQLFDTEIDAAAHINCRCTMIPEVGSLSELGMGADYAPELDAFMDPEGVSQDLYRAGANVDESDGTINVYHFTTPDVRDTIERTGKMSSQYMDDIYFTTNQNASLATMVDNSVMMRMKIPLKDLHYQFTIKGRKEAHLVLRTAKGTSVNVSEYLTSGPAKFAQLSESEQLKILGPSKFRAWQKQAVELRDFIGYKDSPIWGRSTYSRSLKEILGPKKAKTFYGGKVPKRITMPKVKGTVPKVTSKVESIFDTSVVSDTGTVDSVKVAEDALSKVINVKKQSKLKLLSDSDDVSARSLSSGEIAVHPKVDPQILVHEYGHLLDRSVLGSEQEWFTQTPEFDNLYTLFKNSTPFKEIRSGRLAVLKGDVKMQRYLTQGREMFARAWEQYVAEKSGNTALLSKVNSIKNDNWLWFHYWTDKEFEPIRREIDGILSNRGMLAA